METRATGVPDEGPAQLCGARRTSDFPATVTAGNAGEGGRVTLTRALQSGDSDVSLASLGFPQKPRGLMSPTLGLRVLMFHKWTQRTGVLVRDPG